MRKIKLIITLLLFAGVSFSQHSYDTVRYVVNGNIDLQGYNDLIVKNDTIYSVGYDNSCGNQRSLIALYDTALNLIVDQSIGQGNRINYLTCVDTLLGNVIAGGVTNETISGGYNFSLSIINSLGLEVTKKTYEKSEWYIMSDILCENSDSSIYSIGKKLSQYNGWQAVITKSNSELNSIWELEFGGLGVEDLTEVCKLNDSSFVATGYTDSYGNGMKDLLLICFSNSGTVIWQQYIGGINDDFGNSILKSNDGGLTIFGTTASFNSVSEDTYLVKTDSLGNFEWSNLHQVQTAQNTDEDRGNDLIQLSNGDYIVFAYVKSFGIPGAKDIRMMRTGSGGNWVGDNELVGGNDDEVRRVIKYNDSTLYFVGYTISHSAGGEDALIGRGINLPKPGSTLSKTIKNLNCFLDISETNSVKKIEVFPLPTSSSITVNSYNIISKIELYSLTGKLLKEFNSLSTNTFKFDLSNYSSGVYLLMISTDEGIISQKIIRE